MYRNWSELFDCLKTTPGNERGIFSCATFRGDEHRFMLATLSDVSKCSIQLKDYIFDKELLLSDVFGNDQNDPSDAVGDLCLDEEGHKIFLINLNGTHLRTYSVIDLRINQHPS